MPGTSTRRYSIGAVPRLVAPIAWVRFPVAAIFKILLRWLIYQAAGAEPGQHFPEKKKKYHAGATQKKKKKKKFFCVRKCKSVVFHFFAKISCGCPKKKKKLFSKKKKNFQKKKKLFSKKKIFFPKKKKVFPVRDLNPGRVGENHIS